MHPRPPGKTPSAIVIIPYGLVCLGALPGFLGVATSRKDSVFFIAGALLVGAAVGTVIWRRWTRRARNGDPKSRPATQVIALSSGFVTGALYMAASVYTVAVAPPLWILDLTALALTTGVSLLLCPPLRNRFWLGSAIALFAMVYLIPLAPPGLHPPGIDTPLRGETMDFVWSADGFAGTRLSPVDSPVLYQNARTRVLHEPARFNRLLSPPSAKRSLEEDAVTEALAAGDLDKAIARGKLALQIDPSSRYARAVTGDAHLRRGVISMRRGATNQAIEDLVAATLLLDEPQAAARASFALGRLLGDSARTAEATPYLERAVALAPDHPAGREAIRLLTK